MPWVELELKAFGPDLGRVAAALRDVDRKLMLQMGRELRAAGTDLAEQTRSAVRGLSTRVDGAKKSSNSGSRHRSSTRADWTTRRVTRSYHEATQTGKRVVTTKKWDKMRAKNRGLRQAVANSVKVEARLGGDRPEVKVRQSASAMPPDQRLLPKHMNHGRWRHPVMGNRDFWVEQQTSPSGWWTDTLNKGGPQAREAMMRILAQYAERIAADIASSA